MARALRLAERGLFTTTPNPRVGAVVVRGREIVGEGFHERAGEAHAEVNALRAAGSQGGGRDRVRHARAVRSPRPHAAVCRGAARREGEARRRGDGRPEPEGFGAGLRRAPRRRCRGRLRPARGRGARAERGLRVAHDPRPALGPAQGRRDPGREDRARERREPVDHRRGRTRRRPSLARTGLRDPHRHRHRQGRRPAADGARGRNAAPAAPGAGGLAPRGAAHGAPARRREPARGRGDRGPGEGRRGCATAARRWSCSRTPRARSSSGISCASSAGAR